MAQTRMVLVEWWGWSDSRCILKVDGIRDELMDRTSETQERGVKGDRKLSGLHSWKNGVVAY